MLTSIASVYITLLAWVVLLYLSSPVMMDEEVREDESEIKRLLIFDQDNAVNYVVFRFDSNNSYGTLGLVLI